MGRSAAVNLICNVTYKCVSINRLVSHDSITFLEYFAILCDLINCCLSYNGQIADVVIFELLSDFGVSLNSEKYRP